MAMSNYRRVNPIKSHYTTIKPPFSYGFSSGFYPHSTHRLGEPGSELRKSDRRISAKDARAESHRSGAMAMESAVVLLVLQSGCPVGQQT